MVLVFSFLSGFIALGYEIVWYRVLGLLLHGTVYVFGTILFFYLAGIAAGSFLARKRVEQGGCLQRFASCQLGIAAYRFVLFTMLGRFSGLPALKHCSVHRFSRRSIRPEFVAGNTDVFSVYSLFDTGACALS